MTHMCVVGSGPSGAACAFTLVSAGVQVTMLDVGIELEAPLQNLARNASAVDPTVVLATVRRQRRLTSGARSIPAKMPFGSSFAYRTIPQTRLDLDNGTRLVTSLALGGLSNAWGANVAGLADHDVDDWPFPRHDLDPYFERLPDLVDVSGSSEDALDDLCGPPLEQTEGFPLGPQGQYVLARILEHGGALRRRGLYCGRSKLAVGPRYATNGEGCVSCGLCMHGCPYNAIFNSRDVVDLLRRRPGFTYWPGRLVRTFAETDGQSTVVVEGLSSGERTELRFDRLYLACGAIGTTSIVARSLDLCGHKFEIKDSTKYLFPFLTDRRISGSMRQPANTLSQIYMQAIELESTPRTVHGQLYGHNDLILDPLRRFLGDGVYTLSRAAAFLLERVMIGMVYLHSDDSGTLELAVDPDGAERGLGRVAGVQARQSDMVFAEYMDSLMAARRELGGRPLRRLARRNPPGLSQHFGGSLPMKRKPDPWSTDLLGRPWGCERTHCVDSSVLPSIPATPTALVLMANAMRIADRTGRL